MILNTEITSVEQVPTRPYSGKFGETWFIDGRFKDGSYFSRGAKSVDAAQKLQSQLLAMVGQTQSFVVEDTNREYQGNKKWSLKEIPGQPQGNYGYKGPSTGGATGGGYPRSASGSAVSSFRYSEQGTREERDSIVRQVALKAAVEVGVTLKKVEIDSVLGVADAFYTWLTKAPPVVEVPAYEKYSNEIQRAVKLKDMARLDALMQMVKTSLAKGSLNLDQVAALDDELLDGKKAVTSAVAQDEWLKQQQEKARQTQPLHESPAMADTLNQAQDAF